MGRENFSPGCSRQACVGANVRLALTGNGCFARLVKRSNCVSESSLPLCSLLRFVYPAALKLNRKTMEHTNGIGRFQTDFQKLVFRTFFSDRE
ncbi:hypothetical protein AVEN_105385-1 [Araneus ventricosus]|uniref:Uncharacterized protein n=1 Tax=Araneus ventricosus TaxID=182803 RepID=A0A4Y2NPS8_ARAVE|nr:hypothetical protein AVEN_105385-1 [Araneus ventricosus]